MLGRGNRCQHVIDGAAETDGADFGGIDQSFFRQLLYDAFVKGDFLRPFLGRAEIVWVPKYLYYYYSLRCQRLRREGAREDTAGQELAFAEPMRLNHQRIALSRRVVWWLHQTCFPLIPAAVFAVNDLGRPQRDVLQLWVRIPDHI